MESHDAEFRESGEGWIRKTPASADAITTLIGDVAPATDSLLKALAETVQRRREHEHPKHDDDWFCVNQVSWAGERVAFVIRRLLDAEAEVARLRAQLASVVAAEGAARTAMEAVLLIPDRDPDAADSSSERHARIGYNDALSDVRAAIGTTAFEPRPTRNQVLTEAAEIASTVIGPLWHLDTLHEICDRLAAARTETAQED